MRHTTQLKEQEKEKIVGNKENEGELTEKTIAPPPLAFQADPVQQKEKENNEQEQSKGSGGFENSGKDVSSGSGALPPAVQTKMESSFGADFSGVNVHENSSSATDMGALAYTQGNDVHFAPGQFKPESESGQELIGHELSHVVQQKQGRVQPTTDVGGFAVNDNQGLEQEADDAGRSAAKGQSVQMKFGGAGGGNAIQRKTKAEVIEGIKQYDGYIKEASDKYGVAIEQIRAIIAVESGGKPSASSGAAWGLMQITKGTWGGAQSRFPELKKYDFDSYWSDPRINIMFGTAVFTQKMKTVGVDASDENFASLAITAYNAGEGTVKKAISYAAKGGSKNPNADCLKPEYLKPAIKATKIYRYYLTGKGKKYNKTGSIEEAVQLKYNEVSRYPGKVQDYLALQKGQEDAPPKTTDNSGGKTGVVTASALNVRSGPGSGNSKVGKPLSQGETVTILEEKSGWVRIADGQWVSGKYIKQATGGQQTGGEDKDSDTSEKTGTVTASSLNVRGGPGPGNKTVRAPLKNGESVTIYEEKNGWIRVGNGQWVSGRYIRANNNQPVEIDTGSAPDRESGDAERLHWDSNPNSRVHSVWTDDGELSAEGKEFNEQLPIQIEAFFGSGWTQEKVMAEIKKAEDSNDLKKAEELKAKLFKANIYSVVETLDVDSDSRYKKEPGKTFCNIYAYDVVTAMGGYLPRLWWASGVEPKMLDGTLNKDSMHPTLKKKYSSIYGQNVTREMNANALTAWMSRVGQKHFGWEKATNMESAQGAANAGNLVIILAANKIASRSGHVNVILPETEQHKANANNGDMLPLQSQAGGSNFKYKAHYAWWKDNSHKDGAAWIAKGKMDSPLMAPDEIGAQSSGGDEKTNAPKSEGKPKSEPGKTNPPKETKPEPKQEEKPAAAEVKSGTVTASALNVRSGPSAAALRAGPALKKGAKISIYEEKSGWYRIGTGQWVSGKYVSVTAKDDGKEEKQATPAPDKTGTVTASALNVRSGPGPKNGKVGKALTNGTQVTIHEEKSGWYRIGDGQWVYAKYIKVGAQGGSTEGGKKEEGDKKSGGGGGSAGKPSWVSLAEGEVGQKEIKGSKHNPRVLEYHATTGGFATDEVPWCASFMNWVMNRSGKGGTGSAMAMSWKNYGKGIDKPAYGSIVVFSYGGGKGHVGIVVGKSGSRLLVLGGNQSDSVKVSSFGMGKIVAYRVPSDYEVPAQAYNLDGNVNADEADYGSTR